VRAPENARGEQSSDGEGRCPGAVGLSGTAEKSKEVRSSADRLRIGDPFRQRRNVGGDESHGLSGEAAERTLIAAMVERRVFARGAIVVDMRAEFRCVAEDRLELGGDRRVIGAGEGRRSERGRCRGGEKLNDERERDNERGQRRPKPRRAKLRPTHLPLPFGATAVHGDSLLRPERERQPNANASVHGAQFVTSAAR
jgi:hypothetical protein